MTTRTRHRLAGLLRPKSRRFRASPADYGHVLDTAYDELYLSEEPLVRWSRNGHMSKSEHIQTILTLIDQAMARSGAFNTDKSPLLVLCDAARLTLAEYETIALRGEGWSWREVAKFQHVSENAARLTGRRGRVKLRRYVGTWESTPSG